MRFKKRVGRLTAYKLVSVVTLLLFGSQTVCALPSGQQVVNGQAAFSTQGNNLTVTNSPNAIIQWRGFSIGTNEAVRFIQQSAASSVLNRVVGQDPSRILGQLQSNGRVFLINPNGILFGQGARVDVNGLVASTLNLSNQDFLAGKYNFTAGTSAGAILNQGTITTPAGGKVYLIAPSVENSGVIHSPQGEVILAAGRSVQLVDASNPDIAVVVSAPEDRAVNIGKILAESGKVGIYGSMISQQGTVSADSAVAGENGRIFFRASKDVALDSGSVTSAQGGGTIKILGGMDNGTVRVNGALDASAPNGGDGGFIETSAAKVSIGDNATITTLAPYGKTGTWLIDPVDFTIAAIGGNMTGTALGTLLSSNSVTIHTETGTDTISDRYGTTGTNGDIFVNDSVSWSANRLTLNAYRNIAIKSVLNGSGTAQLALEYGQGAVAAGNTAIYSILAPVNLPTGNNFSTKLGSDGTTKTFYVITSLGSPGSITGTDLQGMSGGLTGNYAMGANIDASATATWNSGAGFVPVGDSTNKFAGTFDGLGHTISDLYISRPTAYYVGLFGYTSTTAAIKNIGLANGNITGNIAVSGMVGMNYGTIANSYSTGVVSGTGNGIGGLAGYNYGTISNSYSTGAVSGSGITNLGGLVGYNGGGSNISNSHSTGAVSGNSFAGGLVGYNSGGTISNSYSTGAVSGTSTIGGLVGYHYSGAISNSYSTGAVSGTTNIGGLVGLYYSGAITSSYWDTQTSGQSDLFDGRGTGKTTVEMMTRGTFTGWDWTDTWWMLTGEYTRPFLRSEYRTEIVNAHQLQLMALDKSATASYTLAANLDLAELRQASGLWNIAKGFVPVGSYPLGGTLDPFIGAFDGNGHTITGLYINRPADNYIGLFGYASSLARILNIGLINGDITGSSFVGGLAGWNLGTIDASYSKGTIIGTSSDIGGLAGVNSLQYGIGGTISNSYSECMTGGVYNIGGLVGSNLATATISNSFSTGAVSSTGSYINNLYGVGGLVGYNEGTISASYHNVGSVTGAYPHVGGLVGYNRGGVTGSYNTASVSGFRAGGSVGDVGGLVGYNTSTIIDSYNAGSVTGTDWYVGGLTGENNGGTINHSWNTGSVTGTITVGGLVGENYSTITNSWSTGTVTGTTAVGGLVGVQDNSGSSTTGSYSTGTVSGTSDVGGLVGTNWGTITNSYSTGSATGTGVNPSEIGGLVGYNNYLISNSYSTGAVSGATGVTRIGGLLGYNNYSPGITNSYWNTETSGQATSAGGTGLTTAQMTAQASFIGWDFPTTWGITAGTTYPGLSWQLPGTYPAPPSAPPSTTATTPEIPGNTLASGSTVVAFQTVTDKVLTPEAVNPAVPITTPTATGTTVASGGTTSATSETGSSVSSSSGGAGSSTGTAGASTQEEEIARTEAAKQGGGQKKDVHPDDEKTSKYCN